MKQTIVGDRYTLHGLLGSGGMADVFLAHDEVLERDVALKVLKKQYAENDGFVELFRREAQSAASLNHPNLVIVYDWGLSEDETYYMAMEYVPSGTLKDHISAEGFLDPYTATELTTSVARALGVAHERGMIHRDVKSQNILLTEVGTAKVADFGIARAAAATTTSQSNLVLGTAAYISPEQAQGGPVGPWSDLYSLGVVLYEMLTGELPYRAQDQVALAIKHGNEPPRSPRKANPEVPEILDALTLRLLAKDPSKRYGSAAELLEDLRRVRDGLPLASAQGGSLAAKRTVSPATPVLANSSGGSGVLGGRYVVYGRRFKKIPLALAATSVVLLVLIGAAAWSPGSGPQEVARAQGATGGPLEGLDEASGVDERTAEMKEDERGDGSKEGSEKGNLRVYEGHRSSEMSIGSPELGDPTLVSSTAVLQGAAVGKDPETEGEANAVPGPEPELASGPEVGEVSVEEASQKLLSPEAGHVVEGAAKPRSSEPSGPLVGTHPVVVLPAERETTVASEGGSGPTSQDDGEDGEALNAERPLVYEATAGPEVPSHARFEQAKTMAKALAKGGPNTARTVKWLLKDKLSSISIG